MSGGIGPTQAFLTALGGLPIKEPLQDQTQVGDFHCRISVFISAGFAGGFPVPIKLPRNPSFFFAVADNGAVVYQTLTDRTNSTPTTLYLRARIGSTDLVSTNVCLLVG